MVKFPFERLWQPLIFSENMLSTTRKILVKEGLYKLAKEFLTRFYIFFKSVDFVLLQEIQPFLHLLHQSSNSIFDFNLRASFARLSFQVNKTYWKGPILNRRILAFFWKNQFGVLILSVFWINCFWRVK